jgi:hypothetical protein
MAITVKLEDIQKWRSQRALWNNTPLEEIEFTLEGVKFAPKVFFDDGEEMTIEYFRYMGLANVDYLLFVLERIEKVMQRYNGAIAAIERIRHKKDLKTSELSVYLGIDLERLKQLLMGNIEFTDDELETIANADQPELKSILANLL